MWAAAHGQIAVVEFLLQNVRKKITIDFEFIYSLVCFAPPKFVDGATSSRV